MNVVCAGDLLTYLNVWHAWEEHGRSPQWAHRNNLNQKALLRAADIRAQLLEMLKQLKVPLATCDGNMEVVHQVCCSCEVQFQFQFHFRLMLIG
jgi:hypothetical protein